jgi:NAD(P)-dependent dehydrogenase (short-subunit alcohol dehydrogenase family)
MEQAGDDSSCSYQCSYVILRDHLVSVPDKSVLIAGVGGVIGRNVAAEYAKSGVRVRGVSRRKVGKEAWDHIAADLSDAEEEADRAGFDWTVLRPEAVIGFATGNPMNLLMVIAAYLAVTRELRRLHLQLGL